MFYMSGQTNKEDQKEVFDKKKYGQEYIRKYYQKK